MKMYHLSFQLLTIVARSSTLDVAEFLDLHLRSHHRLKVDKMCSKYVTWLRIARKQKHICMTSSVLYILSVIISSISSKTKKILATFLSAAYQDWFLWIMLYTKSLKINKHELLKKNGTFFTFIYIKIYLRR